MSPRGMSMVSIVLVLASTLAGATTWYVCAVGDDTAGDGSKANPWKTIAGAATAGVYGPRGADGDVVQLLPGEYKDPQKIPWDKTRRAFTLQGSGSGTNPATDTIIGALVNDTEDSPGNRIKGSGLTVEAGASPSHRLVLQNFRVQGFTGNGIGLEHVGRARGVTVSNAVVNDNGGSGIRIAQSMRNDDYVLADEADSLSDLVLEKVISTNNGRSGVETSSGAEVISWTIGDCELSKNTLAGLNIEATGRIESLAVSQTRFVGNSGPGVRIASLRGQSRFGVKAAHGPVPGLFRDSPYKNLAITDCQFIDNVGTGVQVLLKVDAATAQLSGLSVTQNVFRSSAVGGKNGTTSGIFLEHKGGQLAPVTITGNVFENLTTGVLGSAGKESIKDLEKLSTNNTFKNTTRVQASADAAVE